MGVRANSKRLLLASVVAATLGLSSESAKAATFTWDGGNADGIWANNIAVANWTTAYNPGDVTGNVYIFTDPATNNAVPPTLQAGHNPDITSLTYNGNFSPFTILLDQSDANNALDFLSGSNITVQSGSLIINPTLSGSGGSMRLSGTGAKTFDVAAGSILTIGVKLAGSNTVRGFNKTGSGTLNLNGVTRSADYANAIGSGAGVVTTTGGTMNFDLTNLSTPTDILGNQVVFTASNSTLNIIGQNSATASSQTFGSLNFNTVAGGGEVIVNVNDNGGSGGTTFAVTSATSNLSTPTLGSTVNFNTTTFGFLQWGIANTANDIISGHATVNGTSWAHQNGGGFVQGLPDVNYNTTGVSGNTAANYLTTSNVDVTVDATPDAAIDVYTVRFNAAASRTLTLQGNNTVSSSGILNSSNVGANTSTITGGTIKGSAVDLAIHQHNTAGILNIASDIIVNGTAGLTKSGPGTLRLSNSANAYSGNTIVNGGKLQLGASNVIPDGAGKGNIVFNLNSGAAGSLDLNSFSETVNGFTSAGAIDNSAASSASVLTIGNNNGASTLSGVISNSGASSSLAIAKIGTGALTISGANTYSGGTTLGGGTVTAGHDSAFGTGMVTLNGGTLATNAVRVLANNIDVTGNTKVGGNTLTFTGTITGAATFDSTTGVAGTTFIQGDISGFTGTFRQDSTAANQSISFNSANPASIDGSLATFNLTGAVTGSRSVRFGAAGNTVMKMGALTGAGGLINVFGNGFVSSTLEVGHLNTDTTSGAMLIMPNSAMHDLKKVGTGTLTLATPTNTSINVTVGKTYVENGTLKLGTSFALGNTGRAYINMPVGDAGTLATTGTLDLNGQTVNESITLNGTGYLGTGALINSSGTAATIASGVAVIELTDGGTGYTAVPTVAFAGSGSGATATAVLGLTAASFTLNVLGTQTYSSPPVMTSPIINSANFVAILDNDGHVIGATVPVPGVIATPATVPDLIVVAGTGTVLTPGTLSTFTGNTNNYMVGAIQVPATGIGTGYTSPPTVSFSGGTGTGTTATAAVSGITLAGNSSVGGSGDITVNGSVGGPGGLIKIGAGTVGLNGINSYSGLTTVSGGTLNLSATSNVGSATSATSVATGATLNIPAGATISTSGLANDGNTNVLGTMNIATGGGVSGNGNLVLGVAGVQNALTAKGVRQNRLTINAGVDDTQQTRVQLAQNGGNAGLLVLGNTATVNASPSLTIGNNAVLDLYNNDAIIYYEADNVGSTLTNTKAAFNNWYLALNPNGPQIQSQGLIDQFNNDPNHPTTLVIVDNGQLQFPEWGGETLPSIDQVLIKYTYVGDCNLDGQVDSVDYQILVGSISDTVNQPYSTDFSWFFGDMDGDGFVNSVDYQQFVINLGQGIGNPLGGGGLGAGSPIPEPSTWLLGTLAAAGLGAVGLRRRRSK